MTKYTLGRDTSSSTTAALSAVATTTTETMTNTWRSCFFHVDSKSQFSTTFMQRVLRKEPTLQANSFFSCMKVQADM